MADLITSFRAFVEREQLFTKTDKLLLACSGGLDSTVLAHLLHAEGYDFAIAHMNFQLRGKASDEDAAFVEELARALGAKFFVKAVEVKEEAGPGESTQMVARRLRYHWLHSLIDNGYYSCLLTAHHLDDNFETLLINLLRGTGIAGISGIKPRSFELVRPLLSCSREEISAFAKEQQIRWREDASNASDDYLRNRIRHHLSPVFFEEFGLQHENLAKTLSNLRADRYFAREGINLLRKTKTRKLGTTLIVDRKGWATQRQLMDFLHHAVGSTYNLKEEDFRQLLSFPGQRMLTTDHARAYATPATLAFEYALSDKKNQIKEQVISQLPVTTPQYGDFQLTLTLTSKPETLHESDVYYLRPSTFPLHLRSRQNGDRIMPLGMSGYKKVKDILIDNKVPPWKREMIPVLCDDNGEIMALVGYCISEKFKVLPEHDEVLKISVS
jgi:tRNA(Ile)-lysidine synthase